MTNPPRPPRLLSLESLCLEVPAAWGIPLPLQGEVDLYLVSLSCSKPQLDRLVPYLSEEELKRCNRLIDRRLGEKAMASRSLLRALLGSCLNLKPAQVALLSADHGKPYLSEPSPPSPLRFNLSHSGDLCLVALANGREIGVDLETIRDDLEFKIMAKRYFSVKEQRELFGLPPAEQLPAFYRCWTRKEAYLKAVGSGFSQPADTFDVSLLPQQPPALLAHRKKPEETARWTFDDVAMPEGFCAAVVFETVWG